MSSWAKQTKKQNIMTPWTDIKYQYVNEPLDRDDQIIYLDVRYVLNPQLMIKTIEAYLSGF